MSILVLGIGNPILGDDGVGIEVARLLKKRVPGVTVEETNEAAVALLDLIMGYDKLIIIDSIKSGQGRPGELYKLSLEDFGASMDYASLHGMDIATAFEVGESLGCHMPRSVSIYAVEVKDNSTFAERCTPEVSDSIPLAVKQIIGEEKL